MRNFASTSPLLKVFHVLSSPGLISLHFWMFILLPFTAERVQYKTFLVVHETTVLELIIGYLLLNLILLASLNLAFYIIGAMSKIIFPRLVFITACIPSILYFGLLSWKWISTREFFHLLMTLLFIFTIGIWVHRSNKLRVSKSTTAFGLSVAVVIAVLSAQTVVPFAKWSTTTASEVSNNSSSPNLIWLVLDELNTASLLNKDGEIDASLYPGFSRLSQTSTWYSNAITPHTWTVRAVPSILTGSDVATSSDLPMEWLKLLPSNTHQFGYSDIGLPVCSRESCRSVSQLNATDFNIYFRDLAIVLGHKFFPSSLSGWIPSIENRWARFGKQPSRLDTMQWWIDDLQKATESDQPFVTVAHSLLTHHPWIRDGLESSFISPKINYSKNHFIPMTCDDPVTFASYFCSQELMMLSKRMYGLNIRTVDNVLVRILDILENTNKLDSTMIVVTSDHGFAFATNKDGRRIAPSDENYSNLVNVPLFVKYPNQVVKNTIADPRRTTQVLSTVLSEFQLVSPRSLDMPLSETPTEFKIDDNVQNIDLLDKSVWISGGGSLTEAENPTYPLALGVLSSLMATEFSLLQGSAKILTTKTLIFETFREAASKDGYYRSLLRGYIASDSCPTGNIAIVTGGLITGTIHRYPSFKLKNSDGFWGVAQSKSPISNPILYCVT